MSAPSFCWLCNGQLQLKPGGGYYRATKLIDGHERTLHVECKKRDDDGAELPPHIFPSAEQTYSDADYVPGGKWQCQRCDYWSSVTERACVGCGKWRPE